MSASEAVLIYHNPRCSKSRKTLELLRERGLEPQVVEYLENPLDRDDLEELVRILGVDVRDLVRTGEAEFRRLGLDGAGVDRETLLEALASHPILMQRPVVIAGGRAVIGRPPENVLELL